VTVDVLTISTAVVVAVGRILGIETGSDHRPVLIDVAPGLADKRAPHSTRGPDS